MSIDNQLTELTKALNRLADSNEVLAKAYTGVAAAVAPLPKAAKAAAPVAAIVAPPVAAVVAPEVPRSALFAEMRAALSRLPRDKVLAVLAGFQADKLSEVKEDDYAALIATANACGKPASDPLL